MHLVCPGGEQLAILADLRQFYETDGLIGTGDSKMSVIELNSLRRRFKQGSSLVSGILQQLYSRLQHHGSGMSHGAAGMRSTTDADNIRITQNNGHGFNRHT